MLTNVKIQQRTAEERARIFTAVYNIDGFAASMQVRTFSENAWFILLIFKTLARSMNSTRALVL